MKKMGIWSGLEVLFGLVLILFVLIGVIKVLVVLVGLGWKDYLIYLFEALTLAVLSHFIAKFYILKEIDKIKKGGH